MTDGEDRRCVRCGLPVRDLPEGERAIARLVRGQTLTHVDVAASIAAIGHHAPVVEGV